MASCFSGCWGTFTDELRKLNRPMQMRTRRFKRARYNEKRVTIEFENLIDDEDFEPATRRVLTETETELIKQRKYDQLVEQQKKLDAEIDARLRKQEDDLRLEEEAYYEAKREASKVARQAKQNEDPKAPQSKQKNGTKGMDDVSLSSWVSDEMDKLSVTSSNLDEDDFDSFLEKVKARSLSSSTKPVANGIASLPTESWETTAQKGETTKTTGKMFDPFEDWSPSDDKMIDIER